MTSKKLFLFVALVVLSMFGCAKEAEETDPQKILEKAVSTYQSMQTYQDQGTVSAEIDMGNRKSNIQTNFSIALKKPNRYLISWTQNNTDMPNIVQSGTVWSDGTQPYLYMGIMKAYSKMGSDETALGGATGISGGAAATIPSLFLSVFEENHTPFSRLIEPRLEGSEEIEGEACYVISGSSAVSRKETFWISKKRYLLIKCSRSLEPPEEGRQMPETTDEQLEKTLENMGQEVTDENKQNMKQMMERSKNLLKTTKMKGAFTELHTHISSPELSEKDFQFTPPEGTTLKQSLFGGSFGSGVNELLQKFKADDEE